MYKYVYKINPDNGNLIETNLVYTPMVSKDGKTMCMHFDHTSTYQTTDLRSWLPERPDFTKEMVKFFFDREVFYIAKFAKYSWAPSIIDINLAEQKIYFEYSGETCNQIVYGGRDLDVECPTWREQMRTIITDIVKAGYYKTSLYPHCYFIDNGVLRTFDFYGCADAADPYVELDDIRGMIGETSGPRFVEATKGKMLNVEILFKRALQEYVKWPDNLLPQLYKELFDE
jgi:hypothetical protein